MPDPVFIAGVDSQIGTALEAQLRRDGRAVIGSTRRRASTADRVHLDLSEPPQRWQLPDDCPVTFLLAGMTALAQCEAEPELTRRVNVEHTLSLAHAMAARGSHVVFVSTNLVLSGAVPDAPTSAPIEPQCAYARQKADVEQALLASGMSTSVLRITKLAETLTPLLTNWAGELTAGRAIKPFSDLVCAPLRSDDLIAAMLRIGDARSTGIVHVGARPDLGYDQIAVRLAKLLGIDQGLVRPTTSAAAGVSLLAKPRYTTLDTSATEASLGLPSLHSEAALDALLAQVRDAISGHKDRDN